MMTYQMPTAKVFISEEGLRYGRPAPGYPTYSTFGIGGRTALRPSQIRKFPLVLPLNSNHNENTLVSSLISKGKLNLNKEDKVISEDVDQGHDIFGKHFLSEKTCTKVERTSTTVPPLRKDNNEYRHVKLHPLSLSAEFPSIRSGRLFTLGQNFKSHYGGSKEPFAAPEKQVADPRISEVNFSSPSTLFLNGKNNFSVESCKLSRPKVHYPTYTPPVTVKNDQKSGLHVAQTYSDPIIGAPRSFIHRISELSSLEGETVRYEKMKKIRKSKKSTS
ncbi:putative uncharacterized protein C8orf89 homolog [Poecilia formosa]|uniref:putative uncharacterized protein C8orf89 homolog n=1 Tax=Poecilia formosa TaxID=48698 RepID=UPI0004443838|nr:PREDICTED: uncharacterized protein LOC103139781 [Poecilia formosa]